MPLLALDLRSLRVQAYGHNQQDCRCNIVCGIMPNITCHQYVIKNDYIIPYNILFYLQLKDFRLKMGNMLPILPKNDPPTSRTEFSGLNDLMTYLSEDYGKKRG